MEQERDWEALRRRWGLEEVPVEVLRQALTHPSFLDNDGVGGRASNQRLEFLGDAVLGLVVSEYLYHAMLSAREGDLTGAKSHVVCGEALARVAEDLALGSYVLLGPQERVSGGARKPSILADCVEALIGAVYLASGLEGARRFVLDILGDRLHEILAEDSLLDPKSELQQILQAATQQLPSYVTVRVEGPPHERQFDVEVRFRGRVLGVGRGTSKQRAQQSAARDALERKNEWLPEVVSSVKQTD
jgi:ribonuclease-3